MKRAIKIKANGDLEVGTIAAELKELQALVGGCIEVHRLPDVGADFYCNEDGVGMGMPLNPVATAVVRKFGFDGFLVNEYLQGDILILGECDSEGDPTSLANEQVLRITAIAEWSRGNP